MPKDDDTMYSIGLVSTATDMVRFVTAQINDGVVDGHRVFPAEVVRKARTRQVDVDSYYDGYAWGWQLADFGNTEEVFHTGGFTGASALISFLPERDIGIVMLQNESGLKANYLASIVKNAAYRILAGEDRRDVAAWMDDQAAVLARRVDEAEAGLAATEAEKASMPWGLTANMDAYVGTYSHELAGTIEISRSGADRLSVSWGNLRGPVRTTRWHSICQAPPSTGSPYTGTDSRESERMQRLAACWPSEPRSC